jgi:hypothetical protein
MNLTTVEQILALIERYGLSTVFLILLVMGLIIWLKPKMDMVWNEYSKSRDKTPVDVNMLVSLDLTIKGLLKELQLTVDCDFSQLWQFHNGIFSLGLPHLPFLFASITHEVTSDKVTPMSTIYRNIPITLFGDVGDGFLTSDFIVTTLTPTETEKTQSFALGADSYVVLPISNREGKLAALLAAGWANKHEISDPEKLAIKIIARRIGIVLADALTEAKNEK